MSKKNIQKIKTKTGWGNVATWYDKHLKNDDTYHAQVIVPNLFRLLNIKKNDSLLELGCGQGYFLEKLYEQSIHMTGVDISNELISIALKNNSNIQYICASADDLHILNDQTFDIVMIVLALQNMKHLNEVVDTINRLLTKEGRVYIVLNHPSFRIPQFSDWTFDETKQIQSRRVDAYMSSLDISIDMNPGSIRNKKQTQSFHRPLQVYSKSFMRHGLSITKIEEWISHKKSQDGPRQMAEDKARKEFPMFMCLEFKRIC